MTGDEGVSGGWRKSSFSVQGNCVEVSAPDDEICVYVRHSKYPDVGSLAFTRAEWAAFLDGVRAREFDL